MYWLIIVNVIASLLIALLCIALELMPQTRKNSIMTMARGTICLGAILNLPAPALSLVCPSPTETVINIGLCILFSAHLYMALSKKHKRSDSTLGKSA